MTEQDTETTLRRTILLFNRTRAGEAQAKLVSYSPLIVVVEFTGGFCYGCGVTDITDGFADQYKHLTNKNQLKEAKTVQINPRTIQTTYNVKPK